MVLPSGDQYEISAAGYTAVVTEGGAALRVLRHHGRDLVHGFDEAAMSTGGRGQLLVPWPNRIRDGRYSFDGVDQQLALTEPTRHNAIHGLARHVEWTLVEHAGDQVRQSVRIHPQPGWPGTIAATLTHRVDDSGLSVQVEATNIGSTPVPFGYAAHPYLTVGESRVDDIAVTVPAAQYLVVDDRLLPIELAPVTGRPEDLRSGGPLGDRTLDTALTDLSRDPDDRWRVRLELGERFAELWAGSGFGWIQVFTGEHRRDLSLAVEPMTCGPDAFNAGPTHAGMITLGPGEGFRGDWGITGG